MVSKLNTVPEEIISTDLCLYDVQKATLGGVYQEFILSARLDNLMLSFCTAQVIVFIPLIFILIHRLWSNRLAIWRTKILFEWRFGLTMKKSGLNRLMEQCQP